MKLIRDIYAAKRATGKPVISLEFFPPKTEEGDRALLEKHIPTLMTTRPDFCSVTYGAGGSTRDKTLMIVDRIQREHNLTALAHLTCVNHTREQVGELLQKIKAVGCKNILALRGDPPAGGEFVPTPGGFEFSSQLVKFIREQGGFGIGCAGFPEGHIACKEGKLVDWTRLKDKINATALSEETDQAPAATGGWREQVSQGLQGGAVRRQGRQGGRHGDGSSFGAVRTADSLWPCSCGTHCRQPVS